MLTEEYLIGLIGQEETRTLKFESERLFNENTEKIADDLSKAVSGFANAQGGRIVIGMREGKRGKVGVAEELNGVDGALWTTHRVQQIVESNVEPPIRPRFRRVALPSIGSGRFAFVVDVPEGTTAHQAKDGRYYVRSECEFKSLRDYEIRLRMHRAATLSVAFDATPTVHRLGTGNGEADRSTLFHARSDDVVPLAVKLFALDLQFSQFLL